jgi:hypothetical protein
MKIKIAKVDCSLMNFGTLVDCSPAICFLCKEHKATWFEEREVSPKELVDLIKEFKYVIR